MGGPHVEAAHAEGVRQPRITADGPHANDEVAVVDRDQRLSRSVEAMAAIGPFPRECREHEISLALGGVPQQFESGGERVLDLNDAEHGWWMKVSGPALQGLWLTGVRR